MAFTAQACNLLHTDIYNSQKAIFLSRIAGRSQ